MLPGSDLRGKKKPLQRSRTLCPLRQCWSSSLQVSRGEGEGDASEKGIGFALMREGQLVTYASRSLTKAEQNYLQIEKELLAQVSGNEYNHQYVHGRKVTLWTDHKPLEIITKKPLAAAPKRQQLLMMRATFKLALLNWMSLDKYWIIIINAVWCENQVQAWSWDVSCRCTFDSILDDPFCEFPINIWATDPRNPWRNCQSSCPVDC